MYNLSLYEIRTRMNKIKQIITNNSDTTLLPL